MLATFFSDKSSFQINMSPSYTHQSSRSGNNKRSAYFKEELHRFQEVLTVVRKSNIVDDVVHLKQMIKRRYTAELHSIEEAYLLLTTQPRVRFPQCGKLEYVDRTI